MRIRLSSLMWATLGCSLLLAAARRFLPTVIRLDGLMVSLMLLPVGAVVGSIVGNQNGPRWALALVSMLFYFGLVNGFIEDFGDEMTMWAFVCLATGLMFGAVFRPLRRAPDANDEDDESLSPEEE